MSADTFERLAAVGDEVAKRRAARSARERDEAGGIADFANPIEAARSIVKARFTSDGRPTVRFWQGELHMWNGRHYVEIPTADVRQLLYEVGAPASMKPIKKRTVDDVRDALCAVANLSHRDVPTAPAWLDGAANLADARALIPLRNGLLDVGSGTLHPHTPSYFSPYSLPFEYVEDAPLPSAWLSFLDSVWPGDEESIEALQEWLGYLLTLDTRQQKGLAVIGPKRSGKGTIGRLLGQLLGELNVVSPTLASLGEPFGLQPIIGKALILMSDARLGKRADTASITENLLRIIGEDSITIARKFQAAYTAKPLARVVIFANEVPAFRDAASALPSRFIILKMDRSFYGAEDHELDRKITAELPGILLWALEGLRRLRNRGRFLQPAAALSAIRMMEDLASPISAFLREVCVVEAGGEVPIQKIYTAWRDWCAEHGRDSPGTEQTFGRDIVAAAPGVRVTRKRIEGQRVRYYSGVRLRSPDDGDAANVEDEA